MDYLLTLVPKAIAVGLLGSVDGVAHTMAHPSLFKSGRFCLLWATIAAALHFSVKIAASTVATTEGWFVAIVLRLAVLVCIIFILCSSGFGDSEGHDEPWVVTAPRLWALPALLGAVDAFPVGFVKGLVFESTPPSLVLQCAVSSVVLGCTTLLVARLAARAHLRQQKTRTTASVARSVHQLLLGLMFGIILRDIHQLILG